MNKLNYLSISAIIILLISTAFFYSKNINLKQDIALQISKTKSENIFSDPNFSVLRKIPADWKTYRNEKYGFEIKYPSKFMQFDNKIEEDKTGQSNYEISLYHNIPPDIIAEPFKSSINKELSLGMGIGKVSNSEEMKKIIQSAILEWQDRADAYLQNSEEIIISSDIKVYKLSFLYKTQCQTPVGINDENLNTLYYITNYNKNLYVLVSGISTIKFNQCAHPDFFDPSYTQSKEYYQNQLRQYILNDQIISTIKFIK